MLDNYRELIDELLGTPGVLRGLTAERSAGLPPAAVALVAELRDRDDAVLRRVQAMTREPHAYLRAFAPAAASEEEAAAVLSGFDTARGELVSLLMNLTLKDWEKTALDEVEGQVSVADEVERHVEFDEEHVARLRGTLGAG